MSRRTARDDAALAEAFRRLDAGGPRTPRSAETIQATATATAASEAERIDAALRGLIQPTAAPDTLAGRVAADVARSRAAALRRGRWTGWAARRPAWATALAAAVVGALLGGAGLAAAGGGGTIGERARGVGEWVRDVMGVGLRASGVDERIEEGSYYWVPGMGILPLQPDAVVAAGPVTTTIGGRSAVIEGLVADRGTTRIVVRFPDIASQPSLGNDALALYFRSSQERAGFDNIMPECTFWSFVPRPQVCALPPIATNVRDDDGAVTFYTSPEAKPDYLRQEFRDRPPVWNPSLQIVRVPVRPIAVSGLPRASKLDGPVERGGLAMVAWTAAKAGQIAVRFDPVNVGPHDRVLFLTSGGEANAWRAEPYAAFRLLTLGGAERRPIDVFNHVDWRVESESSVGWHQPADGAVDNSLDWAGLPATAVFSVPPELRGTPLEVRVGPVAWHVELGLSEHDAPLSEFRAATFTVSTKGKPFWEGPRSAWKGWEREWNGAAGFPMDETMGFAGTALKVDRGLWGWVEGDGRNDPDHRTRLVMRWSQVGGEGRTLVGADAGLVHRKWRWPPLRRWCDTDGELDRNVDPALGSSIDVEITGERSDRLTLCLTKPVFVVPGPWEFTIPSR